MSKTYKFYLNMEEELYSYLVSKMNKDLVHFMGINLGLYKDHPKIREFKKRLAYVMTASQALQPPGILKYYINRLEILYTRIPKKYMRYIRLSTGQRTDVKNFFLNKYS